MYQATETSDRPTKLLGALVGAALLAIGGAESASSAPASPSSTPASPPVSAESDDDAPSASHSGPVAVSTRVSSINVVSDADERRMRRDIAPKLADRADEFLACYRTHALGHTSPDRTIHVDWTITTGGEAVDVTVFSSHDAIQPCIARAVSGETFAHVDDRHPRVRVELSFAR